MRAGDPAAGVNVGGHPDPDEIDPLAGRHGRAKGGDQARHDVRRPLPIGGRVEVGRPVRRHLAQSTAEEGGHPEANRAEVGNDDEMRMAASREHLPHPGTRPTTSSTPRSSPR